MYLKSEWFAEFWYKYNHSCVFSVSVCNNLSDHISTQWLITARCRAPQGIVWSTGNYFMNTKYRLSCFSINRRCLPMIVFSSLCIWKSSNCCRSDWFSFSRDNCSVSRVFTCDVATSATSCKSISSWISSILNKYDLKKVHLIEFEELNWNSNPAAG